jgi:hypothetical protein
MLPAVDVEHLKCVEVELSLRPDGSRSEQCGFDDVTRRDREAGREHDRAAARVVVIVCFRIQLLRDQVKRDERDAASGCCVLGEDGFSQG